jgi:guanylate kinase
LECFEVFGRGYWYGTLRQDVTSSLERGVWVILEIDVNGAMAVAEQFPDAITIFLRPPSMQELERRLRGRESETEASIARRLEVARRELEFLPRYKFDVINETVEQAVSEIREILKRSE